MNFRTLSPETSPCVLVLSAHPDDAEIMMGGTIAKHIAMGYEVHVGIASIPSNPGQRKVRIQEAREASALLGTHLHLIHQNGLQSIEDMKVHELVGQYDEWIAAIKPQIIYTHWAEDSHQDHQMVARAALAAARRQFINLFMCCPLSLAYPLNSHFPADTFIDVSDTVEKAVSSIRAYKSQVEGRDYVEQFLARTRYYGRCIQVEYAEAFKCVFQQLILG